jgi:hypothetical protein
MREIKIRVGVEVGAEGRKKKGELKRSGHGNSGYLSQKGESGLGRAAVVVRKSDGRIKRRIRTHDLSVREKKGKKRRGGDEVNKHNCTLRDNTHTNVKSDKSDGRYRARRSR